MTHKEFVTKSIDELTQIYSLGEARAISVRLITHFLKLSEYEYIIEPNVIIPKPDLDILNIALSELLEYRPIQYVLGYENFAGHKFNVSESVLIPRPETEEMVRLIISEWKNSSYSELKIFDACTGSGCIAYSLAAQFPKSTVMACDFYDRPLEVARNQKIFLDEQEKQPLRNIPIIFKCDILDGPPDTTSTGVIRDGSLPNLEELDIIVSNPPYICEGERDFMDSNVAEYEPDEALFVPDNDPLRFYKALSRWAVAFLKMGGKGYFEINEGYYKEVISLFEGYGFSDITVTKDIHSKPRIVSFTKWY